MFTTMDLSILLFCIMLLFPIAYSLIYLYKKGNNVLDIPQSKVRDARYFAKSFVSLFEQSFARYDGTGKIRLSKDEKIILADDYTSCPTECDSIVYAERHDFIPSFGVGFKREIYAKQNAYLFGTVFVRAMAVKKDLILGSRTHVLRWVDAEGILVALDHCDLGISASSVSGMVLGENCTFRRLYAPVIFLGQAPDEKMWDKSDLSCNFDDLNQNILRDIRFVDDNLVDSSGILAASIITKHSITVLNDLVVKGHIRSHRSIRLCDNAVVYGNLFAEGDIRLGENTRIYGTVFSQERIFAESGVVIGTRAMTKSVIARKEIVFEKGCCVYGYISTETKGISCPNAPEKPQDIESQRWEAEEDISKTRNFCINTLERRHVVISSLQQFGQLGQCGFRNNEHILDVVLPEGISTLPPSFFNGCRHLHSVTLPSSVEEIGDYAFYGCDELAEINLGDCKLLKRIGESSFEGCRALRAVCIPASCEMLESGALLGSGIESVLFETPGKLSILGSHVFKDCVHLVNLSIPQTVTAIGTSAFYGCTGLQELVIPDRVNRIGGFVFWGCTSLSRLEFLSRDIAPQENILEGLPEQTKLWFSSDNVKSAVVVNKRVDE